MELVLSQGSGWTTFWLVLLACIAVTSFFYARTFVDMRKRRFAKLLVLRILTIVVVVLLLFRPVIQYTKEQAQKKSIVFAVDTSSSMSIGDATAPASTDEPPGAVPPTKPRIDQVKDKVRDWGEKLSNDFNLHLLEFSDHAETFPDYRLAANFGAEGKSTSLSWAVAGTRTLMDGARKIPKSEIEALFIFSDGQHNTARNPVKDTEGFGVPVYAIGVGTGLKSSADFKDIQVSDIQCPERLTLNNKAIIKAGIDAVGLGGRVIRVVLEEDASQATAPKRGPSGAPPETPPETPVPAPGATDAPDDAAPAPTLRQIGEVELTLDDNDGPQEVSFEFKPEKVGRTLYLVRALPIAEESIRENNERQTAALVVEPGMRVLYIEGTIRTEYGAITDRYLSKDPDVEYFAMVQTRPNLFTKRTNIEGMEIKGLPDSQEVVDQFDVFILGDIDSSYFKPAIQEMIVKRVRAGAGLIMLGGYHSLGPGGWSGTPVGNVLPVMLGDRDIGQFTDPFMPKLTPDGQQSRIFANIADFFPSAAGAAQKDGLPMLDGCTNVLASGPGATVLATCPAKQLADQREMPVLAVQPVGEGRTAVFTADTTRKWQQGPKALNLDTPFMQFWGQMVRYLAGRDTQVLREAGVSAEIDKAYYEPEESIRVTATVRNAEGEGTDKAKVTATLTGADGKTVSALLEPIPQAPGKFQGDIEPKSIGRHDVRVDATIDGAGYAAPEKMLLDIGRPNMEFDRLDLNEDLMVKIADATGGRYAHVTTADFLIDQLNRDQTKKRIVETIDLAPPLYLWCLFVGLLTVEWWLRRRYHLR